MNRWLSLVGLLALAACASTAPPREHGATAPQFFHIDPLRPVAELLPYEWWHFDYRDWKSYAIQNLRFEMIGASK
jgi:hypothetical protein